MRPNAMFHHKQRHNFRWFLFSVTPSLLGYLKIWWARDRAGAQERRSQIKIWQEETTKPYSKTNNLTLLISFALLIWVTVLLKSKTTLLSLSLSIFRYRYTVTPWISKDMVSTRSSSSARKKKSNKNDKKRQRSRSRTPKQKRRRKKTRTSSYTFFFIFSEIRRVYVFTSQQRVWWVDWMIG